MNITPFDIAQRFVGMREVPGATSNPHVLAMLRLDGADVADDETSWCSAFVSYCCWILRVPRSHSLAARSWLGIGRAIDISEAVPGFDVVIFWRCTKDGWQGHVGFFAGLDEKAGVIHVLGGNQGDKVCVADYPIDRLLGVRRLA